MRYLFHWEGPRVAYYLITKDYLKAGQTLANRGYFEAASKFFKRGGHKEALALTLEKSHHFMAAASVNESIGQHERAGSLYLKSKNIKLAKNVFKKMGRSKEYAELLFQKQHYQEATQSFLEIHEYENAAKALLKLGESYEASLCLLKGFEKAVANSIGKNVDLFSPDIKKLGYSTAKLLHATRQLNKASEVYWDIQEHQLAIGCLIEVGEHQKAAEMAEESGYWDLASQSWRASGQASKAESIDAERLANEGKLLSAIEKFLGNQDHKRVADLYVQLQEYKKAAYHYEQAKQLESAAYYYKNLRFFEKAGTLYEKVGNDAEALDCFEKGDLFDLERSLLLKKEDFLHLASRYLEKEKFNLALQELKKIPKLHPNFHETHGIKGRVYLGMGNIDHAKKALKISLEQRHKFGEQDLENLYVLCRISGNQMDIFHQSISLLKQKLDQNLIHPRVQSKAQELLLTLTSPAFEHIQGAQLPSLDSLISFTHKKSKPPVNRYSKLEQIGKGGMGSVYKAIDQTLGRVVALKTLHSNFHQNDSAVNTFFREAKSAAALNHPHIVTVYDFGKQNEDHYIAMEFIEGMTLKQVLKATPHIFSESMCLNISFQIMDALAYAHSQHIIHRDLTTNNIMLTSKHQIKIMDFGLAKMVNELMSEQSIIGGTPSFMSPEQTKGTPIDHRSDIYSLGITLFEIFTQQLPFKSGDLAYHHLHTVPPKAQEINPQLSPKISLAIEKCLQKSPDKRFQHIHELKKALS